MNAIFRVPDYLLYGLIVALMVIYANSAQEDRDAPAPPRDIGELLPGDSLRDPNILVNIDAPKSGVGTAFSVHPNGTWLTARHVVDSCDKVALKIDRRRFLPVTVEISKTADIAVLKGRLERQAIRSDLYTPRRLGESGFFFGFPQSRPGEVAGRLIGRSRLKVKGRYNTEEPILAWAESGRSQGLKGSLGGLSGGPVLDIDGEVIGLVAAESLRRGRIYTVAPRNLRPVITEDKTYKARQISFDSYGLQADEYRRNRQIVQVVCLVNSLQTASARP